jgi:hypothetical protein
MSESTGDAKATEAKADKANDSGDKAPVGAVRGDVRPAAEGDEDAAAVATTPEKEKDEKTRDKLIAKPGDSEDDAKHTTDHIPAYNQTHATPGIPYSENPLNPGMNPVILPGGAPGK